jgi:ubiquitin carboxyl-terminal hydrolase 25/28
LSCRAVPAALFADHTFQTSDSVENQEFAQKAISIIARERKSNTLNDWLTTGQSTGYQMSPDEALRHLGVDHSWDTIDKSVLPVIFDAARNDRPGEQTERAVATLEQAMSGTAVNSHSPETWPVGLTSHGNTCYLNSILQYYFSIKPFREIILNYERHEFDTSVHEKKTERVGQRHVDMMEVKGGQRFAKDLKNLFERMIRDRSEHVRPEDDLVCRAFLEPKDYALLASGAQEVRDAQNSALNGTQEHAIEENVSADMTPTTVPAGSARNSSGASSVTLNGDDADMKMSNDDLPPTPPQSPGKQTGPKSDEAPPLPPRRFSTTREQALERAQEKAKSQQDVSEVHDDLTFRLRAGLEPKGKDESGEQEDELRDLYKIGITETIVKDGDDGKQKHMNDTGILLAPPSEATDIYSMLDTFFDLQVGGQTESGPTTEFYKTMRNLPPLLQINIPRILFEQETNRLYKSEASIKLEDELYLDRYVDSSDPETLPKRKACWGWRKRLHTLRKEQKVLTKTSAGLDGPTAISETAQYLNGLQDVNKDLESIGIEGLEVDGDLPTALLRDGLEISERLLILKTEIEELTAKLKDQFTVGKKHKYRLAAVFFHRGNFGHGHYWIYIHDFAADIWRVYNDERVEEFTKLDEIFEANTWNHGTPTFAVYVQDDRKLDIIQPVCRSPEKAPTPEPVEWSTSTGDVNMNGAGRDADASTGSRHGTFLAGVVEEGGQASWDEKRQVPGGNSW